MKKVLPFLIAVCLAVSIITIEIWHLMDKKTVVIWTQKDQIHSTVLEELYDETKIHVELRLLEELALEQETSIEELLKEPACDLLLADQSIMGSCIQNDLLLPLTVEERGYLSDVSEEYCRSRMDPDNEFTLPAFWTTMGLLYHPSASEQRVTGWSHLFSGELSGGVIMPQVPKESFAVALMASGLEMNHHQESDLEAAALRLWEQKSQVLAYAEPVRVLSLLQNGKAVAVPCTAVEGINLMSQSPELSFLIPSEGSWRELYSYGLIKQNEEKREAREVLQYLCRSVVMAECAAGSGYEAAAQGACRFLEGGRTNPLAYPHDGNVTKYPIMDYISQEDQDYIRMIWDSLQANEMPDIVPKSE